MSVYMLNALYARASVCAHADVGTSFPSPPLCACRRYASPVEQLVSNYSTTLGMALMLAVHPSVFFVFLAYRLIQTYESHSGYDCSGPVLCCAVLCCAVLCCAVLCCAVLCCAVLCCAVLCCAVLCCAVLRFAAVIVDPAVVVMV